MPTSFLTAIHLAAEIEKAEAARRLGTCLPLLKAHGLEPFPFAADAWQNSTPGVFGGTTLIHREFSSRTEDPLWGAGFMFLPAPKAEATQITMTTPANPLATADDAWHWLTKLAEELCDAMGAQLGLINGFTPGSKDRSRGGTPAGPEVAPGHPPEVLCPWMYWSAARLDQDDIRDGLRSVGDVAYRSSASPTGGWVLQAYDDHSGSAPEELLERCAEAWHTPRLQWLGLR